MERNLTKAFWMLFAASAISILAAPTIAVAGAVSPVKAGISVNSKGAITGREAVQRIVRIDYFQAHNSNPNLIKNIQTGIEANVISRVLMIGNTGSNIFPEVDGISAIRAGSVIQKNILPQIDSIQALPEISSAGRISDIEGPIYEARAIQRATSLNYIGKNILDKTDNIEASITPAIGDITAKSIESIRGKFITSAINTGASDGGFPHSGTLISAASPIFDVISVGTINGSRPNVLGIANSILVGIGKENIGEYGEGLVKGVDASSIHVIGNELIDQRESPYGVLPSPVS